MAKITEVILGTEDNKKLTGIQARAQNKASFSTPSGIFPNFGNGLEISVNPSASNQIRIGTGLVSVDGCIIEVSEIVTLEATEDGSYTLYAEANLLSDKAFLGITTDEASLVQDDLTENKVGVNQYPIATFTVTSGGIEEASLEVVADELIYNVDGRYERAVTINNDYTNEDIADMNMAQIINLMLTPFSGYGAGVVTGIGTNTNLPALKTALIELVGEFYETISGSSITMRLEVEGAGTNGGSVLQVAVNDGATYMFTYDNYGTDFTTVNADAFRRQIKNVGKLIQEDKWDTLQKREIVMYDGGRSFIENGQSITLNKGGYETMASFEKVTLIFERFNTNTFETLGYGFKQVHQQNFTISEEGFYNTNTEIFPLSFAIADPKVVTKAWDISALGVLSGRSLNNTTNRGYVLVGVIGTVTEAAFKGVDATTRKTEDVQAKTMPVSQISPDVKEVIMADSANAYDIYNMSSEQVTGLKTKLGIESEE